ncbi:MAG: carbohydrate kinase family protein [Planctomycetota bacterium]|nr:carbohydrate kinase family protein [Planctomycetota bacterium]
MTERQQIPSRESIASAAADALERAHADGTLAETPALAGFDGFLDSIIRVVDRRGSMALEDFAPISTISDFAGRIAAAAGKSTNIELVVDEIRFGGNGPLYAGALGRLGMPTTYVGAVGRDDGSSELLPIFEAFAARCERVIPIAAPAYTDALEFADGKIMFGRPVNMQAVTWERLVERVGLEELRAMCARARLLGIVDWTHCGGLQGIWEGLIEHVLPGLEGVGGEVSSRAGKPAPLDVKRRVFIDLSDPAKRTDADLRSALEVLRRMNRFVSVTLGLNLAEGERVAAVLGVEAFADAASQGEGVRAAAARVRARAGLSCVVIHPREGAGAADDSGQSAWFEGPFTAQPRLSTGAGDHFGAGFSFAQVLGLPLGQALAVGCAVSGAYVRDAVSPDLSRLTSFLRGLPGADEAADAPGTSGG